MPKLATQRKDDKASETKPFEYPRKAINAINMKRTITYGGSTELYAVYTVDKVYTVDTVDMVYTALDMELFLKRWGGLGSLIFL